MKFSRFFLTFFLFFFFLGTSSAQNCTLLKNNSFTYRAAKNNVLVEFKEKEYIEYHLNKKYYIKSKIEWVSDCEYYLVIEESTLPDFPFEKGTKMHIIVTQVKGNKVYYKSSLAGRIWEGKMKKVRKKS
tara:strand:+ start:16315 stop:16701 length:387 start_codon:yes stop_codon:yes gene_type:complete